MSYDATDWAFKQKGLKTGPKIVLLHLAHHHNPEHGCFPSQQCLAHECGMSVRSVRDQLKSLEELGLITRRSGNKSGGKSGREFTPDHYVLHFDRHLGEAGKPAAGSSQRQNLPPERPAAKNDRYQRQNLPPNKVKEISKTRAREAARLQPVPDRPAPHLRRCIPAGSLAEELHDRWLSSHGYLPLSEIGEPIGDGYDALFPRPPSEDDQVPTMLMKKWAERLMVLHGLANRSKAA
ncbi:MAG: helix-turn-helix domain-containing protein [Marinovum algicola]|uniref:helix-turn-helix domain-containing protein n=1 Tax=Roseobacteraceae TaxID=2854170 RepID=UPI0032EBD5D8